VARVLASTVHRSQTPRIGLTDEPDVLCQLIPVSDQQFQHYNVALCGIL
jgi:hypothetical protein